jgi:hypothetical protein
MHTILCLAAIDLQNVGGWGRIGNDSQSYLVSSFKHNLELLQKRMPLVSQINPQILYTAFVDLNSVELQILHDALLESTLIPDCTRTTSETLAM